MFDPKKKLGHGSGSGRSGPGRVEFWVEQYRFFRVSGHFGSGFGSFGFGSGRVLGHLISDNLGFRVVSGQVGLGRVLFCLFGSGQISGRQTLKYFFS
jgi:hypothetical protein